MRVLIVDDSPLFREALREWLMEWSNWEAIATVSDGMAALDLARAERPDLILMDLNMPGWDGLETTRRIKAEVPEARILILTASDADAFRASAIRNGAEDCIDKDAGELRRVLERLTRPGACFATLLQSSD